MENILIFDTGFASFNKGDDIIMECTRKELAPLLQNNFEINLPTHVSPFHWYQILKNSTAYRTYADCKLKFVGGSNIMVPNLFTHYAQWNINLFNYQANKGCIMVGVGAGAGAEKGSLLVYCLDNNEELDKLVSRISKEKKLIPFSTNPKPESSITPEEYIKPSVPSWLRAFKEAEFVITDSFHACVFSLVFNKPFLVFGNANRGLSRFESLLSTFGQQQRMLTCAGDYNKSREYPSLDNVDEILSRLRSEAFDYLNKSMI